MGTRTKLIADLNKKPASMKRDTLLENARQGHYHDVESPLPAPKVALCHALDRAGYADLAEKARGGEYDE